MGSHVLFQGGWNNLKTGVASRMKGAEDATFEMEITVDFKTRTATAKSEGKTLTYDLPKDWKQIEYYGYYVKDTQSRFSPIEVLVSE